MRAIDADALYKKLNDIRKEEILLHGRMNNKYCCTLSTALYEIDNAPTIETERKKGKWINIRHDNIAECDQCGITGRAWMNFCFDCGADMREEN